MYIYETADEIEYELLKANAIKTGSTLHKQKTYFGYT